MTIQSLQKIISLERELYAAEQVEQEKAAVRLKEEQAEILQQHQEQLAALEGKRAEAKARAADEATLQASALICEAKVRADHIDRLDDSVLRQALEKTIGCIVGRVS